jgi:hypothetical protein
MPALGAAVGELGVVKLRRLRGREEARPEETPALRTELEAVNGVAAGAREALEIVPREAHGDATGADRGDSAPEAVAEGLLPARTPARGVLAERLSTDPCQGAATPDRGAAGLRLRFDGAVVEPTDAPGDEKVLGEAGAGESDRGSTELRGVENERAVPLAAPDGSENVLGVEELPEGGEKDRDGTELPEGGEKDREGAYPPAGAEKVRGAGDTVEPPEGAENDRPE